MVTVHADTRRSFRSKNHLSQYRKPNSIFLVVLAILSILPFVALGGGGGTLAVTIPLPASFIIKIGGPSIYQAFITGGNGVPFFTESNFTQLVNDDILGSAICSQGCSIALTPGNYNETQKIQVKVPLTVTGPSTAIILPQNTFTTPAFNVSANSFRFDGPRIDDAARKFQAIITCTNLAGTGCHIPIVIWGALCLIRASQFFNITTVGIFLTRFSSGCEVLSNTITGDLNQFNNSSLSTMQGVEASGMSQRIHDNTISYIRGGAGIRVGGGTINNAIHNSASGNTLFHNEYGVQTVSAIDVRIVDNTIYNSTSHGIIVSTALVPSTFGPLVIGHNSIGESGQGLCCGSVPGLESHIDLAGSRCCWYSVSISGNVMLDRQSNQTTKTDIEIASQNYRNLTIVGNSVGKARTSPTILLSVTPFDRTWIIADNPGFNPQPVRGPLTAGGTPFTYTNLDGYKEQIELITIGDMTAFTCRGIANIIHVDAISPILNTLDTCVFTYVAVAPTYDVLPT